MARLISYKRKDVNRYETFTNASFGASNDSLMFNNKVLPTATKPSAIISPSVHKKSQKGTQNESIKPQRKWITCCWNSKWVRKFFSCHSSCMSFTCKRNSDNDDDIDKAVVEFQKQQGISDDIGSQKSTLKSEKSQGYWRWDESWKSNSDKFLESLELDCVGSDKSLKRAADKLRVKNSKIRKTVFNNSNGGGFTSLPQII